MNERLNKWDNRFLDVASLVSFWSKDPNTRVGAVIVRPNGTIASTGYNGFPQRMCDPLSMYEDRNTKLSRIVHAEMNAILFSRENLVGYTLYTYPFLCCDRCAVHVIQSGIKRVVAPNNVPARWRDSINTANKYFDEAGVEVDLL